MESNSFCSKKKLAQLFLSLLHVFVLLEKTCSHLRKWINTFCMKMSFCKDFNWETFGRKVERVRLLIYAENAQKKRIGEEAFYTQACMSRMLCIAVHNKEGNTYISDVLDTSCNYIVMPVWISIKEDHLAKVILEKNLKNSTSWMAWDAAYWP